MSNKKNNGNLTKARVAKNDEFYTRLSDIENELSHYTNHFKGQTVYCNCDDARVSAFVKYFSGNFERLGLKRLIATCYKNQGRDLFDTNVPEQAIHWECSLDTPQEEAEVKYLKGDGDFRSAECVELLKQSDIVVTNPPFSLFREYFSQLVRQEKKFLVISHMSAITYKSVFPYIRDNKVWLGVSPGGMYFERPDGAVRHVYAVWFTNLTHGKRNEKLILHKEYNPEEYPMYDNYDAIEVGRTADIPKDYYGVMGVPISFLEKCDISKFEIFGMGRDNGSGFDGGIWQGGSTSCLVGGRARFKRLFIRRRRVGNG